ERRSEVIRLVESHARVGAEPLGARQPAGIAAGRDDPRRSEQPRGLHGDEPNCPGGPEYQGGSPRRDRRAPDDGQPPGEPCDPERAGQGWIGAVGHVDRDRVPDRNPLGDGAVAADAEAAAEEVDDSPVARASDALASRGVRQWRVTQMVQALPDRDVNRVDRGGEDLDDVVPHRVVDLADLGRSTELANQRALHGAGLSGAEPTRPGESTEVWITPQRRYPHPSPRRPCVYFPKGGLEMLSTRQIWPVSVTTYALVPLTPRGGGALLPVSF